jgi:hypothetical protein
MKMPDYIPSNDEKFLVWTQNLHAYALAHAEAMKIDTTVITALIPLMDAYADAFAACVGNPNHGKIDVRLKNQTKDALKKAMRVFVSGYITYNPNVTDIDRDEMSTPIHDKTPTPVPPPTVQAEADISYPGIHEVELKIHPQTALPAGATKSDYGVRIYWGVLDPAGASSTDKFRITVPPASGDDLCYSATPTSLGVLRSKTPRQCQRHCPFTRKTRHRFDYSEEDRGKHVYFCLRYENSKGDAGPWGPILSAVIP